MQRLRHLQQNAEGGGLGAALIVAAHCAVTGTHKGSSLGVKATGLPIEIFGMGMAVVRDGRIQESWNYFDFMSLYQQVGMLSQLPGKA